MPNSKLSCLPNSGRFAIARARAVSIYWLFDDRVDYNWTVAAGPANIGHVRAGLRGEPVVQTWRA